MPARIGSFNLWGIDGKDVGGFIRAAHDIDWSEGWFLGFQELWFRQQADALDRTFLSEPSTDTDLRTVTVRSDGTWSRILPKAPPLDRPLPIGPDLELTSGLAMCVRGSVETAVYVPFVNRGATPDCYAHKGILAVKARCADGAPRAFVTTHLHNSNNDLGRDGLRRQLQLEEIAGLLHSIADHWVLPIALVGDFNTDALDPTDPSPRLTALVRSLNRNTLTDMNLATNRAPIPTLTDGSQSIDFHLLSFAPPGPATFATVLGGTPGASSDHMITVTSW